MYKLLTYIIYIAVFIGASMWFKHNDGVVTIEWFDKVIDINVSFLVVCAALALIALIYLFKLIRFIFWAPSRIRQKNEIARRDNGHDLIMQGFSALASGNVKLAQKFANKAAKQLKDKSIVHLLNAQIGVASSDNKKAEENYKLLAEDKNAEFLGKRGLIAGAVRSKDNNKALELAEELIGKNKSNQWSIETALNLSLREQKWDKSERYLASAKNLNKAKRKDIRAFINFSQGYENSFSQPRANPELVEKHLKQCLKNQPEASPGLIMLSEAYINDNENKKAKALLEKHWNKAALQQCVNPYYSMFAEQPIKKKIKHFTKFAAKNSANPYSYALLAKAHMENSNYKDAIAALLKAASIKETSSICKLMAEADEKLNETSNSFWREKAESSCFDNVVIDKNYYKAWIKRNADDGLEAQYGWNLYINDDLNEKQANESLSLEGKSGRSDKTDEYLLISD